MPFSVASAAPGQCGHNNSVSVTLFPHFISRLKREIYMVRSQLFSYSNTCFEFQLTGIFQK